MIRQICDCVTTCKANTYSLMDRKPMVAAGMLAVVGAVLGLVVGSSVA